MGIILGYYDMLTTFNKVNCGDASTKTAEQIKDVVVNYLKEHPAERSEPAARMRQSYIRSIQMPFTRRMAESNSQQ